jgi:hypothetical protein
LVNEPRVVDREEQSTEATGLHDFDVDAVGEHGDFAAADESFIASLCH